MKTYPTCLSRERKIEEGLGRKYGAKNEDFY